MNSLRFVLMTSYNAETDSEYYYFLQANDNEKLLEEYDLETLYEEALVDQLLRFDGIRTHFVKCTGILQMSSTLVERLVSLYPQTIYGWEQKEGATTWDSGTFKMDLTDSICVNSRAVQ